MIRDPIPLLLLLIFNISEGKYNTLLQQDMIILINTSLEAAKLHDAKLLIDKLLYHISISPESTRVGLIYYGYSARVQKELKNTVNREAILKEIRKLRSTGEERLHKLQDAIDLAKGQFWKQRRDILRTDASGHVYSIPKEVEKVVVVIDRPMDDFLLRPLLDIPEVKLYIFSFGCCPSRSKSLTPKVYHYNIQGNKNLHMVIRKVSMTKSFKGAHGLCPTHSQNQLDECKRRCTCVNGRLKNCYRIRHEFTQLSIAERKRFNNVYKALGELQRFSDDMSNFLVIHSTYFCRGIHTQQHFFPWHRWYVLAMENIMRQIDCSITIPFWDWGYWNAVAFEPSLHIWGAEAHQLGSDGVADNQYCVTDGPYASSLWNTPPWCKAKDIVSSTIELTGKNASNINGKETHRCLKRGFNNRTPYPIEIQYVLSYTAKDFKKFEMAVRRGFHNNIHNAIGGHMCTWFASASPEFFMHHAMLDRIWHIWQMKSLDRKYIYFREKRKSMSHLKCPYTPFELIDSRQLPDEVKAVYAIFPAEQNDSQSKDYLQLPKRDPIKVKKQESAFTGGCPDVDDPELAKQVDKELHSLTE